MCMLCDWAWLVLDSTSPPNTVALPPHIPSITPKPHSYGGLPPPGEGALLDIGSGIGKQVFAAACLWPWRRVAGIEIYERRHKLAVQALARWEAAVAEGRQAGQPEREQEQDEEEEQEEGEDKEVPAWDAGRDPLPPTTAVSFACGDVVEEGAEGFDVLLLVSAAFTDSLIQTMAAALDDSPVGTMVRAYGVRVEVSACVFVLCFEMNARSIRYTPPTPPRQAICITKGLPSEKWAVLHDEAREEPWGRARLIIQRKAVA